uniref:Uncharacterized protein n=1 Tax=Micrurus spixii TaxID=129469 RepID=A0A2D4MGW3_9SAUR
MSFKSDEVQFTDDDVTVQFSNQELHSQIKCLTYAKNPWQKTATDSKIMALMLTTRLHNGSSVVSVNLCWAFTGHSAAAGSVGKFCKHSRQPNYQSHYQAPEGALLIDSLAEDGQEEDGGNGWAQVAGDGLDVVKELPALRRLDHGHPGNADTNQAQYEQPANDHELPLLGGGAYFGVDVHGEEGAGAIKDGSEGAHQRGQHHREHQASQSIWHELHHHRWIGNVCTANLCPTSRLAHRGNDTRHSISVENAADHAWHHHQEHGQQLQVAAHDAASLDMGHVFPREASLDNDLVSAPIPQGQNAQAKDESRPREVAIHRVPENVEGIWTGSVALFGDGHVIVGDVGWDCCHVLLQQALISSDFFKSCGRSYNRSGQGRL